MKYSHENLTSELSKLMATRAESQQRIKDLEEYVKALNDREKEGNMELERQVFETFADLNINLIFFYFLGPKTFFLSPRLKERVKKMSSQMKHDEEKRKSLQVRVGACKVR